MPPPSFADLAPEPAPEPFWRRRAAWFLVALAYVFASPYFERLNNPNENVRIWAVRAIVEHGKLSIDQVEREWGYVNDKAQNGGHLYSGKAPGATFLGVPIHAAHAALRHLAGLPPPGKKETTFWLRLLGVKLPLLVFLWFFSAYVERLTRSPAARDLLVVGLGLGTLLYPYGQLFVGHALAAAATFGSFMLLAPAGAPPEDRPARRLLGAGLLAGSAVAFEYQALFVVAALFVFAAVRYRGRVVAFCVGATPPAVALATFHTVLFGRPWRLPPSYAENPEFHRIAHSAGFVGLSVPKLDALGTVLFSPELGLFIFSPVLLLGVVAAILLVARPAWFGRQARGEGVLVGVVSIAMFLFLAGMAAWRAGWCAGPRYITTVAPFLAFAIARAWPLVRERPWLSALCAGLVVPSVLLNVASGAVYPHYPEVFDNPVFDVTFPLLDAGYAPYGVGWLLGLRGLASLAPLAAVTLTALALGVAGDDARPGRWAVHAGVALVVAASFLLPLSAYGRQPRPAEQAALAFIRSTWEPVPALGLARNSGGR